MKPLLLLSVLVFTTTTRASDLTYKNPEIRPATFSTTGPMPGELKGGNCRVTGSDSSSAVPSRRPSSVSVEDLKPGQSSCADLQEKQSQEERPGLAD